MNTYDDIWAMSENGTISYTPGSFGHSEKTGFSRWIFFPGISDKLMFEIVSRIIYPIASIFISHEIIWRFPEMGVARVIIQIFMGLSLKKINHSWGSPLNLPDSTHDFTKAQGLQPKGAMAAEDGGDLGGHGKWMKRLIFHGD